MRVTCDPRSVHGRHRLRESGGPAPGSGSGAALLVRPPEPAGGSGGLCRDGDRTEGGTAPASFGSGAAALLRQPFALPRLAPEVPARIRYRPAERSAAALAEALLAEGILREADYDGRSILESIGAGLTRWVDEITGGEDLWWIEIGLHWTDDIEQVSGMKPDMWYQAKPGRKQDEEVGIVGLMSLPWISNRYPAERDILVGRTVRELEAARPGLGFQVLSLLSDVLPLVGMATPHYGYQELLKYDALARQLGSSALLFVKEKPGVTLTAARYLEEVPLQACEGKLRPEVLRKARKFSLPPHLSTIVARACDLLGRFEALRLEARLCDSHVLTAPTQRVVCAGMPGHAAKLPLGTLRWSQRDELPRVVESYVRQTNGHGTNLCWCQGWQASDPEGTRRAVRHWRSMVNVILRACLLAELMHTEEA